MFPFPFGTRDGYGNGATERQCGHGVRIRKRKRMNGNIMLEPGIMSVSCLLSQGAALLPGDRTRQPLRVQPSRERGRIESTFLHSS